MALFGRSAKDINFDSESDFFESIGYLSKPGKIEHFEAQVPDDKVSLFTSELPGQDFYPISNDHGTTRGDKMKRGIQLRIYLNNTNNIPSNLNTHVVKGNRINKGLFAEKLLRYYGFKIGTSQDETIIRSIILRDFPAYISDYDRGRSL